MTYQNKVERFLRKRFDDLIVAQWIAFIDANGRGYAQPDFYIVGKKSVTVIEAKLSQCPEGLSQIDYLYRPLLHHLYSLPVVGVLVFKNITGDLKRGISGPWEVLSCTADCDFEWHFVP